MKAFFVIKNYGNVFFKCIVNDVLISKGRKGVFGEIAAMLLFVGRRGILDYVFDWRQLAGCQSDGAGEVNKLVLSWAASVVLEQSKSKEHTRIKPDPSDIFKCVNMLF